MSNILHAYKNTCQTIRLEQLKLKCSHVTYVVIRVNYMTCLYQPCQQQNEAIYQKSHIDRGCFCGTGLQSDWKVSRNTIYVVIFDNAKEKGCLAVLEIINTLRSKCSIWYYISLFECILSISASEMHFSFGGKNIFPRSDLFWVRTIMGKLDISLLKLKPTCKTV